MKKFVVYLCVLIRIQSVFAQSLSIDLSIAWKDKESFCSFGRIKNLSSINIPYLTVKYKNLTNQSIYFFNGLGNFRDENYSELEPFIIPKGVLSDMDMERGLKQTNTTLFDNTYKVYINYLFEWFFEEGEKNINLSKHTIDSLSDLKRFFNYENEKKMESAKYAVDSLIDYLSYVQNIFYYERRIAKIAPSKQLLFFDDPNKKKISIDKARDMISKKDQKRDKRYLQLRRYYSNSEINSGEFPIDIKNQLVFLKPQEEYIIQFDLISFYVLGGHFIFYMKWKNETNHAIYSSYDKKSKSFWYHDIFMPEEVNGYKYFTGNIDIDPVELKIN